MDTFSKKQFDKNYEFDKNEEKDLLGTLYTNSRFYSSMDGWSKQGMIEYNKLCSNIRDEKLLEENSAQMRRNKSKFGQIDERVIG